MHVEKGAYFIAFLGAFLSALAAAGYFVTLNWPMVVVYLISLFVFLSIIWAQKKRNPKLYMPFLVINGIGLFLTVANLLFLIIAIIFLPEFYTHYIRDTYDNVVYDHPHRNYAYNTVVYVVIGTAILITAITLAIYAWFYCVVLHAYQYMKDVQKVNISSIPIGGSGTAPPPGYDRVYQSTTVDQIQQKV